MDATAADAVEQVREALGESADVVFDCVAEQSTMAQAIGMANKGGTVVVVGVPAGEVSIPLQTIQDSQLRIQGSATYLPEDYADAMRAAARRSRLGRRLRHRDPAARRRRGRLPRRRERRAHQGAADRVAGPCWRVTCAAPTVQRMADVTHYDVVVVGSGFGGSVTALRLTEKGYRVGVLEAGRRFDPGRRCRRRRGTCANFLWAPRLGLRGIQRITLLKDIVVLSAAGVGGGSLVYANTLYQPPAAFFDDPHWAGITDWPSWPRSTTRRRAMLGVTTQPSMTPSDVVIRQVAEDMGVGGTFRRTPVGVFFGEPGKTVPDPYFGGAGPDRTGCIECGNCMIGCRIGAKNRLDLNYLYLAERAGAVIHPDTTVTGAARRSAAAGGCRPRRASSPRPTWCSRPARSAPSGCCTR